MISDFQHREEEQSRCCSILGFISLSWRFCLWLFCFGIFEKRNPLRKRSAPLQLYESDDDSLFDFENYPIASDPNMPLLPPRRQLAPLSTPLPPRARARTSIGAGSVASVLTRALDYIATIPFLHQIVTAAATATPDAVPLRILTPDAFYMGIPGATLKKLAITAIIAANASSPGNLNNTCGEITGISAEKLLFACRHIAAVYAYITECSPQRVMASTISPIRLLLDFNDDEVRRSSSAALGNLVLLPENRHLIASMNVIDKLVSLTFSENLEVQCNASGCITNLVTDKIIKFAPIPPLLFDRLFDLIAKSPDVRVARNAAGALLNLTHTSPNRQQMIVFGAIPAILEAMASHKDPDVLYYMTTTFSNLAVESSASEIFTSFENTHNDKESGEGFFNSKSNEFFEKLIKVLMRYMCPPAPLRLQTQATLALRNLASSEAFCLILLSYEPAFPLFSLLVILTNSEYPPLLLATLACWRNLSICNSLIVRLSYLGNLMNIINNLTGLVLYDGHVQSTLVNQLLEADNMQLTNVIIDEIQMHSISTLRNFAATDAGGEIVKILMQMRLPDVFQVLLARSNPSPSSLVECEVAATLALLATDPLCRREMLESCGLLLVIRLCKIDAPVQVISNSLAALANLAVHPTEGKLILEALEDPGVMSAIFKMLASSDWALRHHGLRCVDIMLLLEDPLVTSCLMKSLKQIIGQLYEIEFKKDEKSACKENQAAFLQNDKLELLEDVHKNENSESSSNSKEKSSKKFEITPKISLTMQLLKKVHDSFL